MADTNTNSTDRLPVTRGTTVVQVYRPEDLPTPAAGLITLEAKYYLFMQTVDIGSDEIVMIDGSHLAGVDSNKGRLISNNATSVVSAPAGSTMVLDTLRITQDGAGDAVLIDNTSLTNFVNRCRIEGSLRIAESGLLVMQLSLINGGFFIAGANSGNIDIRTSLLNSAVAAVPCLEILPGAAAGRFALRNAQLVASDALGICVRVDSPTQVTRGLILSCNFTVGAGGSEVVGVTASDDEWKFIDNTGIDQSQDQGDATHDGGATFTVVIAALNTWTDITGAGAAYTLGSGAQKFSLATAATGELEYDGVDQKSFQLGMEIGFQRTAGMDVSIQFAIAHNGTEIAGTITETLIATNSEQIFRRYMLVSPVLVNGDTLRLRVQNVVNADDIDVDFARIVVL